MFREQRTSLFHKQGEDNNLNFFSFLFVCEKTNACHEKEITVAKLGDN